MNMRKQTWKAVVSAAAICVAAALPSWATVNRNWVGGGDTDLDGRYLISAANNWDSGAPAATDNLFITSSAAIALTNDTALTYNAVQFNSGTFETHGNLSVNAGNMRIPATASKTASVHKMNGDWTLASEFHVGHGSGSNGKFIHSGGTFTLSKKPIYIGSHDNTSYTSEMVIDGGTVYASCPLANSDRSVILGWKEKGTGTAKLTVSGTGRLICSNHIWLGRGAAGRLDIDGGEVSLPNGSVFFFGGSIAEKNFQGNQTSLLYINGGVLTVQSVGYGASHSKARIGMYFNGGTLRAAVNHDDFIAIYNRDNSHGNVRVLAPGGTIDTNGHTINVQQLLDPPGSGTSGDLIITGGGTYKQTGATAYNGRTVVDGNTKYIKNNESTNLKLVVKGGSAFQNAATLAGRVAGASLTFEDGAKLVVEPTANQIAVSAPKIDVQGTLTISSSPTIPPEGRYTLVQITGSGTFAEDVISRITFEDAPAGLTLVLSEDRKSIGYTYYAHDWCWTGEGDGVTFGDPDNWHCKTIPGATSDLYFSTAPAKTLQNDIDNFTVRSILFTGNCASLTIAGKQISMAGGGITNELNTVQTFTASVAFPDDVAISAKQNIYMKGDALNNESGRIEFAGGVGGMQNNVNSDNRVFCGHWSFKAPTVTMSTDTAKRTTIYKNSSLEANTLEMTQALHVMSGSAVTAAVIKVTGKSLAAYNYGEIVVTNMLSFPASGNDLYTTSMGHLSTARVKVRKLVLSGSKNASLGTDASSTNVSTCDWYLGEDGMNVMGTRHFFMHHTGDVLNIHPWKCDTAINAPTGGNEYTVLQMNKTGIALNFFTDDEDGVARTITLNGTVWAAAGGTVTVKGAGTVAAKNNQILTADLSVADTATYAIDAGCTNGTGIVTVGATATLKTVGAGRAEVGGLTLADGATLAFEFTDKAVAPVLAVVGGTGSVPSTVNVKITAADGVSPRGGTHILTSGADFTGATVNSIDAPEWVKRVGVDGSGNVFVEAKPKGLMLIVK